MLRFFRQIRQSLFRQNRTKSYFLYAVGEILLVVVGILIALQVNNWNEERKLLQEEHYLLEELHREFTTNLNLIRRDFRGNQRTLNAVNGILALFEDPGPEDRFALDSLIVTVFTTTSYDAITGVVDEIISTGRLNVIQDDSLRYLLSQWPSVLSNQQEDIDIRWGHFESFVLPLIIRSYPIKNVNAHFDFSFWTDTYKRMELSPSAFKFKPEHFFTPEMEGLLYVHSLNQDFILMNDLETEKYINQILSLISANLD